MRACGKGVTSPTTLLVPQMSLRKIHPTLSCPNPLLPTHDPLPCLQPRRTVILVFSFCPNPSASATSIPPPPCKFRCTTSFLHLTAVCFSSPQADKPDCTERLQLQRRLGCRTFHWFLANVYPELYPSERRPRFSGKARRDPGKMRRKRGGGWWDASQDRK